MKKIIYSIIFLVTLVFVVTSCLDKEIQEYDFDRVLDLSLAVDTTQMSELYKSWNVGDSVNFEPIVEYKNGDVNNLVYAWYVMSYIYEPQQVGNSSVYPSPDTICRTKKLQYKVDLEPGYNYQLWCSAKDTVTGVSASYKFSSCLSIPSLDGNYYGIYCFQTKDGKTDIDVLRSARALILGSGIDRDIYSTNHPNDPLAGTPKLMYYSATGKWFYLFTDQEAFRITPTGMQIMDTWENGMFYNTPDVYSPEALINVNKCDFLINNGEMHVLYASIAGNRLFPASLAGDYDLYPFLSSMTIASYGAVSDAIGAYQVVYNKNQNSFQPYYNKATGLSQFNAATTDALFDVNNMLGTPVYINTVNGGETAAIMKLEDGSYQLNVARFYNVVDDGILSRYNQSLSGCEGLDQATCFESGTAGSAIFYGSGSNVYSYSYTTGQTTSNLIWTGDAGEEITCMRLLGTGGFPTAGRILWIAAWNEATQKGRIIEFEINPTTGLPELLWSEMFSGISENPVIHEDFGKVYSMIQRSRYD